MNLAAKIGYNDNPPQFEEKRFSEVKNLKGVIIREAEQSPVNVNTDKLAWLLAHKRILPHQNAAGERLQKDWAQAEFLAYASLEGGRGGSPGTNRPADTKTDANRRFSNAMHVLGNTGERIVTLVVLENMTVEKAAAKMRLPRDGGMGALKTALDALARHYGLSTK